MNEEKAIAVLKCLADASRLRIMRALYTEPMYVELLAERLELTASTVSFHLKKLEGAGLVSAKKDQYYLMYSLDRAALDIKLIDMVSGESSELALQKEREDAYRRKVVDSFFEYGKLKSIPVQRKKRRIILEELVKSFEYDRKYTEREVNIMIADYNDDFCTIRREMIAEELMGRDHGIYWRKKDETGDDR